MSSSRRAYLDLHAARHARGTTRVPGSKSISIRALLLAALSEGETTIEGLLQSDDTTVMIDALRALGVPITEKGNDPERGLALIVSGASSFPKREADVFVGNSGLSIRTLVAALAFAHGHYRLSGIARMHERPIGDLVDALTSSGAHIRYEAREGYPPLRIEPAVLVDALRAVEGSSDQCRLTVAANTSSQFLTGLLQAAPMLARDADLAIEVEGELISRPYIDLTIALMRRFGVDVSEEPIDRFNVAEGSRYASPGTFAVEGDASSASYLLAAGLLGGGPLRVEGIGRASLQGDARFVDVLIAMGAQVSQTDDFTEVSSAGVASGLRLRAIDADFNDIPDAAMTVAILALFANGPCTLRNIASWRVKETDRVAAMATELAKLGAQVEAGHDWLRIDPLSKAGIARLDEHALRGEPITIATYDDHRMAMCFSLVRFLGIPIRIEDPDCVAKTFPDYFERFETLVEKHDASAMIAHP
jgi:3-phosphoshikimate 1-carboxyvinyltransferase